MLILLLQHNFPFLKKFPILHSIRLTENSNQRPKKALEHVAERVTMTSNHKVVTTFRKVTLRKLWIQSRKSYYPDTKLNKGKSGKGLDGFFSYIHSVSISGVTENTFYTTVFNWVYDLDLFFQGHNNNTLCRLPLKIPLILFIN